MGAGGRWHKIWAFSLGKAAQVVLRRLAFVNREAEFLAAVCHFF